MRLLQIWIPDGRRADVTARLDDLDLDYTVADESGSDEIEAVASIPLPTAAVESILEELRASGIDESTYTIVLDVETLLSEDYERLEEQYVEEPEATERGFTGDVRIAREELAAQSRDLVHSKPTYYLLTLVSAVIATAGLLLDSAAIVVGSMVIAPLIGPSLAASVGTVIDDRDLFRRGLRMQVFGVAFAILSATMFAVFVRYLNLVPPGIEIMGLGEVSERAEPNFLVLAIALGAGIAGIVSLMTGVSTALVGVMIAVALIPPAAAVGVGVAFTVPRLALGASVIVVVNLLSINLASLLMLRAEGYRPAGWLPAREARGATIRQVAVLLVGIALISTFLFGVTYDSYVASTTEEEIRAGVVEELEQTDEDLELRELTIDRSGILPPLETERVIVEVAVPADDERPQLIDRLADRIEAVTDTPVEIVVEFVFVERSR